MAFRRLPADYDVIRQNIGNFDWSTYSVMRFGTEGADTMRGGAGRDTFYGGGSNDTFIGNGGVDTFYGGSGTDTVDYSNVAERAPEPFLGRTGVAVNLASGIGGEVGEANDHYDSIENVTGSNFDDALFGNAEVNVLRGMGGDDIIAGGGGGDTLDGGEGIDMVDYSQSASRVTVNLQTNFTSGGDATGDVISGFENISGSRFNDTLIGNDGDNLIMGGAGADTLDGAGGFNDTVSYRFSQAGVVVDLSTSSASGGDAAGDIIRNFENIEGSGQGDTLTGSFRDNVLIGGRGNDTINGGRGNDTIDGGADDDTMTGGLGSDAFVFRVSETTGHDHITDFNVFEDVLRLDTDGQQINFSTEFVDEGHVNLIIDLENGDTVTIDNMDLGSATLMAGFGVGVEFV